MLISHKHRFIFIHIPKNAGISMKLALMEAADDWESIAYVHATASEVRNKVGRDIWDNYFKFAFVKNPWDRAVSFYFWSRGKKRKDTLKVYSELNRMNYDEWAQWLSEQELNKLPAHVWLQKSFVTDMKDNLLVDYVGRFENLDRDWNFVCRKIGIKKKPLTNHHTSMHEHYMEYYGHEGQAKMLIQKTYKEDIDFF